MRSLRPNPRFAAASAVVLIAGVLGAGSASAGTHAHGSAATTTTPIKHVIVIVGENHTFDNVFATYRPRHGQSVKNLLSEGIVKANGDPGPNVRLARQWTATDTKADGYSTDPKLVAPYKTLPAPNTTYVDPRCDGGQAMNANDTRFPANLPNTPFQITKYVPYDEAHAGFQVCVQRRLRGRPAAPVLPDEPADGAEPEQAVGVDGRHGRRLERRGPDRHDRPGRRVDGLLQRGSMATRRCSTTWPTTSRCPTTTTRR